MKLLFTSIIIFILITTAQAQFNLEAKLLSGTITTQIITSNDHYIEGGYNWGPIIKTGISASYDTPYYIGIDLGLGYTYLVNKYYDYHNTQFTDTDMSLSIPMNLNLNIRPQKTILQVGTELNINLEESFNNKTMEIPPYNWIMNLGFKQQIYKKLYIGIQGSMDLSAYKYFHKHNEYVGFPIAHTARVNEFYHYGFLGGLYYKIL